MSNLAIAIFGRDDSHVLKAVQLLELCFDRVNLGFAVVGGVHHVFSLVNAGLLFNFMCTCNVCQTVGKVSLPLDECCLQIAHFK